MMSDPRNLNQIPRECPRVGGGNVRLYAGAGQRSAGPPPGRGRSGSMGPVLARALVVFCILGLSFELQAQFPPGFGGGGANTGANQRSRTSGSTTRQYPNNQVGDAVISIDPETRNLIVIADEDTSQYISQVISNLDRPKPQVLIKVVFLELTHNRSSDIGIEGGFNQTNNNTFAALANAFGMSGLHLPGSGSNAPPLNALGQPITSFAPIPPGAGLYQVLGQDYQVTLRAIAQAGKAKILSRPSVVARNNQPATILVGQTVPLITSVRYDNEGNAINGITYTDVGIILRVTPFITSEGMVELIVSPESSAVSSTESVQIQNATFAPVIDKRSADTVVVTPDGQTVIIGGMIQNAKAEAESKIPLLGDIPWLGNLFKRKIKSDTQSELLIFLTPHIIYAPGELAALAASEGQKSEGAQGLTEKELNKYLEGIPMKPPTPDQPKRK
jgi:type II secretion system protein D